MVKYAREPADAEKSAKARASDLRISFKNMRETCMMLKGMQLETAQQYWKDVVAMKRCVVFRRFCGGVGRTAQAKNEGSTDGQGRWSKKCAEALLGLLENAKSNAEVRVDCETLERTHRRIAAGGVRSTRLVNAGVREIFDAFIALLFSRVFVVEIESRARVTRKKYSHDD